MWAVGRGGGRLTLSALHMARLAALRLLIKVRLRTGVDREEIAPDVNQRLTSRWGEEILEHA